MEELNLKSTTRNKKTDKLGKLRKQSLLPAVIYGHKVKNQLLKLNYKEFENVYKKAGENTLIDLSIDGKTARKVIIHELQVDPLTDKFIHIDFYQVRMDEEITAEVPLVFFGESEAVKSEGGVFVKNMDAIEVECLPNNLPREIKVDISPIKKLEEAIHIRDLDIPENVKVLASEDEVVAIVLRPRTKEELEEMEKEVEEKVEEVEGIKEKEGEEEKGGEEEKEKKEKAGKSES
jgi:large subunit ribosomal protein L25